LRPQASSNTPGYSAFINDGLKILLRLAQGAYPMVDKFHRNRHLHLVWWGGANNSRHFSKAPLYERLHTSHAVGALVLQWHQRCNHVRRHEPGPF